MPCDSRLGISTPSPSSSAADGALQAVADAERILDAATAINHEAAKEYQNVMEKMHADLQAAPDEEAKAAKIEAARRMMDGRVR